MHPATYCIVSILKLRYLLVSVHLFCLCDVDKLTSVCSWQPSPCAAFNGQIKIHNKLFTIDSYFNSLHCPRCLEAGCEVRACVRACINAKHVYLKRLISRLYPSVLWFNSKLLDDLVGNVNGEAKGHSLSTSRWFWLLTITLSLS